MPIRRYSDFDAYALRTDVPAFLAFLASTNGLAQSYTCDRMSASARVPRCGGVDSWPVYVLWHSQWYVSHRQRARGRSRRDLPLHVWMRLPPTPPEMSCLGQERGMPIPARR
ncbi:hypothetical protein C8Q77DRAFT_296189 [Trametes polyzona]|nr:hypothetical protein C8Q77DRAFT_296189 [Trametes polyzona]